jgi:uncharacterized protein with PIN domain
VVRASDPKRQLGEVLQRFDLFGAVSPFARCLRCNGLLHPVSKEEISNRLLPETREFYDEFWICPACDQIFWKGSHYERMRRFIEGVLQHECM